MEKPFDDLHVGIESQLLNSPEHIPDSAAVSAARKDGDTVDGLIALGKALSWQLRYRQAILAYTQALKMDPDNRTVLRLRAGRYLTTLQSDLALRDFEQCLAFGGDKKIRVLQAEIRRIGWYSQTNTQAGQIQYVNSMIMGLAQYLQPSICSHAFHAIDRRVNNTALATWKKLYPKRYNQMQVPLKKLSNLPHRHEGYDSKTFAIRIDGKWFGITYAFITHSRYESKPFDQKMTPYTEDGRRQYVNYRTKHKPLPCDRPSINTPEDIALSIYARGKGWKLITMKDAVKRNVGTLEGCNKRTINQFINPSVVKTCQLSMGLTQLAPGSNWNTMPCHTHERRMEVYMYFEVPDDQVVFHMMGEPNETRHIVMKNFDAVISPSWSIHSGVGTSNYTFIWAMVGENMEYDDMDTVDAPELK